MRTATVQPNGYVVGTTAKSRKAKTLSPRTAVVSKVRLCTQLVLGCGIPALSLALSTHGGQMLQAGYRVLGCGILALCCTVLAVSLDHLAWAIRNLTRSSPWQSWALAIAVDCTIVACELADVAGHHALLGTVLVASVTVVSAGLNCWAFTQHHQAPGK